MRRGRKNICLPEHGGGAVDLVKVSPLQRCRTWGGRFDPLKYVGGVRVCFDPPRENVTFFHSKLLLDNSASFTSSRMQDLCQNLR